MSAWAACMSKYAEPRLRKQTTEAIVDGGLAACFDKEEAARKAYINDMGPDTGRSAFVGVKQGVRNIMLRRVAEAKRVRGYR